jgi:DNA-binding response OmpR family regulator
MNEPKISRFFTDPAGRRADYTVVVRLLLVEDEHRLADRLARGLREEGFAVDTVPTTALARERVIETDYDVVLLDLKLPDGSGLDLLAEWRNEGFSAPILVLTAKDLLADKIKGLDAGADDYLTKPFSFEELLARIRALLRRRPAPPQDVIEVGDVRINRTGHRVERAGAPVELTAKEFALLELLALHAGQVLSRAAIAEHVWDATYDAQSNVIDVIVGRLRRKLGGARPDDRLIHTVSGVGYVFRNGGEIP